LGNEADEGSGTAAPAVGRGRSNQPLSRATASCEPRTATSTKPTSSHFRSRASRTTAATVSVVIPIQPPSHEKGRASASSQPGTFSATHFAVLASSEASGSCSYPRASATKPASPRTRSTQRFRRALAVRPVESDLSPSRAVAALVLLTRSAPARIVATDVLVLVDRGRLRERVRRCGGRIRESRCHARTARSGYDVRASGGLVLVV